MTIGGKLILLGFGGVLIVLVVIFGGSPEAVGDATSTAVLQADVSAEQRIMPVDAVVHESPKTHTTSPAVVRNTSALKRMPEAAEMRPRVIGPPRTPPADDTVVVMGKPIPPQHTPTPLMPKPEVSSGVRPSGTAPGPRRYTVRPGDTLSEIAARELGSAQLWTVIVEANPGLDPDRLRVGGTVRIPSWRPASTPTTAVAGSTQPAARTHTVVAGDSLSSVAQTYYQSADRWHDVYMANATLLEGDPDQLQLGMVLVIP